MTDRDKQQKPLNASITPDTQSKGSETKAPILQTRLRPKTKLRGLPQENTFTVNRRPTDQATGPSRPVSWQTIEQQEPTAQASFPPTTNLNNPAYMSDNPFTSTNAPFNTNVQKSMTGQLEKSSSTANNPLFPQRNTRQLNPDNTGQLPPINSTGITGQFNPVNSTSTTGQYNTINRPHNTGQFNPVNSTSTTGQYNTINRPSNTGQFNPVNSTGTTGQYNTINRPGNTGQFNFNTAGNQFGAVTRQLDNPTGMLPNPNNTGTLMHPAGEYSGDTGMLKLNQAVKVVRIPVAGKPGEFKTGILPVLDQSNTGTLPPLPPQNSSWQMTIKKNSKLLILGGLILLLLLGSGIYLLSLGGNKTPQVTKNVHSSSQTQINLNASATANVKATATFTASLLVSDSLAYNTRGWTTQSVNGIHRTFTGNAYHIRSDTSAYFAPSVLLNEVLPTQYTYSVDMQEVAGNNTSQFNYYGLLLNYNQDKANNPSFYLFCIINQKSGSQYEFVRFDNKTATKWSKSVWTKNTGKEFHSGKAKNTLKVQVDGTHFTFWDNGARLGTAQDKTFGPGSIGMGVNGVPGGAEVAFTNLILAQG